LFSDAEALRNRPLKPLTKTLDLDVRTYPTVAWIRNDCGGHVFFGG
jgi:hypothetical protein